MFNRPAAQTDTVTPLSPNQQQLLRLNIDFLKLMQVTGQTGSDSHQGLRQQLCLPTVQAAGLAQCQEAALERMASCGFSLFSLSLHQPDIWRRAAAQSAQLAHAAHYHQPAATGQDSDLSRACSGFMECALFFAWHLSQQEPHHARLLLGMSADCAAIVAQLELWQCQYIARQHDKVLSPRWRHHPYFWADLLRYGHSGDARHFKLACLLGSQLLAQELEPSAILRLSSTDTE
ncbi:MAG: hypothetical protein AB7T07_12780 [Steroidobacteraceae bacterium]